MRQLLIATTNLGKFEEIKSFLWDLPFEFISLNELENKSEEPEETEPTIEGNSFLKAKYYAEKTGLLSLADDGGLFINALDGWPGVKSARIATGSDEQCDLILEKLKDVPKEKREASFKTVLTLYDPSSEEYHSVLGETKGLISDKVNKEDDHKIKWGYNKVFFVHQLEKTYSEMTLAEKNSCSHRGKALTKIKYYLQTYYGQKQVVVPFALIIKDGKVLMTKRNDPTRPDYHEKWEFPGGKADFNEDTVGCVIRETLEETGYDVKIVKMLQHIEVDDQEYPTFTYQVFLIPFVCTATGQPGKLSDAESLAAEWYELDDVLKENLVPTNARMYKKLLPELKQIVKENNL